MVFHKGNTQSGYAIDQNFESINLTDPVLTPKCLERNCDDRNAEHKAWFPLDRNAIVESDDSSMF